MSQFDPPPNPDDEYAPRPIDDQEYSGPGEHQTFEVADEDDYSAADHEKKWYYVQFNQQKGPVSTPEIKMLIKTQQIKRDDIVWKAGMADWISVINIPELQDAIPGFSSATQYAAGPVGHQAAGPSAYGQGYQSSQAVGQSFEDKATQGFILSLIGVLLCQLLTIPGIIVSKRALEGMERSGNDAGKSMATAGYWVGVVGLILLGLNILGVFCYIAVLVSVP